jgi:HAD superfamily hydrolase (TIGR01549 family)
MFGPIHQVVFDFDGTLVDTMSSVIRGLGDAVRFATGKEVSTEELVKTFGPAPQEVLARGMPASDVPRAFHHWEQFEKSLGPADMKVFEGVEEMLTALRDAKIPIGIFTGRDRMGTIRIAQAHGWLGKYFNETHMVCGDDGHKVKPAPDALLALMRAHAWEPATTLMVGDHAYDMMAGRAAGTKTAAAIWDLPAGQGTRRSRFREGWQKWDAVDCDLRLDEPMSLARWIQTGTIPTL